MVNDLLWKNRYRQAVVRLKIVAVLVASLCLSGYGGSEPGCPPKPVGRVMTADDLFREAQNLRRGLCWDGSPNAFSTPTATRPPASAWPKPTVVYEPEPRFDPITDRNLLIAVGLGALMVGVWVGRKRTQKPRAGDDDRPSYG